MDFEYTHRAVTYTDGGRADVYIARFPAHSLSFTTVTQTDKRTRLRDATHLRRYQALARGETNPVIVAWACLERDIPVGELFPEQAAITASSEHILSANSWTTYVLRSLFSRGELRWRAGTWYVLPRDPDSGWHSVAQQVIAWLAREDRLWVETGPQQPRPAALDFNGFAPLRYLLPVGRCGFVRDYAARERPRVAFNTAYFLLEHDDFVSHHSALGEPHGLGVEAGTIIRPPLYRRAALCRTPGRGWQTGSFSMHDIVVTLPGGITLYPPHSAHDTRLTFHLNAADERDIVLYTRSWGVAQHNRVLGTTPDRPGCLEITVVDTRITGWKRDGGLLIPQNGFVLSFADSALNQDQAQAVQRFGHVRYTFADRTYQDIDRALQCGPQLIRDGRIVVNAHSLANEDFWISRSVDGVYVPGVVPSDYPDDVDRTRAGRIGLGVDRNGDLLAVAVPGISKGLTHTAGDSVGATLKELAECLLSEGVIHAINLDGGGSTQLFVDGGLFARQGDRRGYDGVVFDRMVPAIGVVNSTE